MTGRWAPLVVASLVAALLATGAGVGADQVVERGAGASQPRLRTVPASTLDRLGLTLSSVAQPPYCDLTDQAVRHGWLKPGWVGCVIDRPSAEAAARQGSGARVLESLLARVTSQRVRAIGRNRETWLVVVQGQPGSQFRYWPCPLQVGGSTACPMGRLASSRLVLVDASSGAVAGSLNLGPVSGQRPSSRGAGGNGRYLGPGASLAQS
jgi:hypothetical protein